MRGFRFLVVGTALVAASNAHAQFVDSSAAHGLTGYQMADGMAGGVAAVDYDGDGDIDIFAPCGLGVGNQLFQNDGLGNFVDVAAAAGLASTENSRSGLFFDYDGDLDLDLLVAHDCFSGACPPTTSLRMYEQIAGGQFVDVTVVSGLFGALETDSGAHFGGMAAGDLDNDGFLDLFVGFWEGGGWMFANNGDGTFTDISDTSGIRPEGAKDKARRWQPVFHDFDGDGWQDIFVAFDFGSDHLYINQHDMTFVDGAAATGCNGTYNEMGVALGDIDNDRDLDIYITNIWEFQGLGEHNRLYRNDTLGGVVSFVDIGIASGTGDTGWGWGATFLDYDNDTLLDIAVTNGFTNGPAATDQSRFFQNLGASPIALQDVSSALGFADTEWGSGLVACDTDRDGDLDLVQTCKPGPLRLWENQTAGGNYLAIRPRMAGPNTHAIGAIVRAHIGGVVMTRVITAGISTQSQEPAEAFFGLGAATNVNRVVVRFPDGSRTKLVNVAANQVVTVTAPPKVRRTLLPE